MPIELLGGLEAESRDVEFDLPAKQEQTRAPEKARIKIALFNNNASV